MAKKSKVKSHKHKHTHKHRKIGFLTHDPAHDRLAALFGTLLVVFVVGAVYLMNNPL